MTPLEGRHREPTREPVRLRRCKTVWKRGVGPPIWVEDARNLGDDGFGILNMFEYLVGDDDIETIRSERELSTVTGDECDGFDGVLIDIEINTDHTGVEIRRFSTVLRTEIENKATRNTRFSHIFEHI